MERFLWLKCSIVPGFWTNEYAVAGRTSDGTSFSLFVPGEFVTTTPSTHEGLVRVQLLESKGDVSLVSLPGNPLESASTVNVNRNQLTEAA
jgi:hypothetical protein